MRNLFIFCSALPLLITANVSASEVLKYNPIAHCKHLASFGGNYSELTMRGCMKMEQTSYNLIKKEWATVPVRMKKHCKHLASFGGTPSYTTLKGCLRMEQSAKKKNKDYKFKF